MTSAAALFLNWRSRARQVSGPDVDSDPSVSDRDPVPVRRRRRGSSRRRYDGVANRYNLDIVSGSQADGSSVGGIDGSSRHNRMRFTRAERLPNTVLLARERVSERLRGLALVDGRASLSWDEPEDNVFRVVDIRNHVSPRDQHDQNSNYVDISDEYEPSFYPDIIFTSKRPRGLTKKEFDLLESEVFENEGEQDDASASVDCSICLESFCEGNELVKLHCGHRFHPNCVERWVKECGDCPYCRTTILSK